MKVNYLRQFFSHLLNFDTCSSESSLCLFYINFPSSDTYRQLLTLDCTFSNNPEFLVLCKSSKVFVTITKTASGDQT